MHSNYFDNTLLGTNTIGQGTKNVEGTHRSALRILISKFARQLSWRGSWRALLHTSAHCLALREAATRGMAPAVATCPSYRASRCQRQRWMSGVVVDPGTVGVC